MLMDKTETITLTSITWQGRREVEGVVVRELPLTIFLNGSELVTTLCSPVAVDYLVVGILVSEGLIDSKDEIKKLSVDIEAGLVRVEARVDKKMAVRRLFKPLVASGGGKGASSYGLPGSEGVDKIDSAITVSAGEVSVLVEDFLHRSAAYQATRGVHSAALCDNREILVFHDDIGRHNAIDKVFGDCLMNGISLVDRIIITSGRISSEILLKVAGRKIPILASKAAPTDLGVKLAKKLGVTIVRFMRDRGINVYSHDWRVITDDKK
jgi:FdhD protein